MPNPQGQAFCRCCHCFKSQESILLLSSQVLKSSIEAFSKKYSHLSEKKFLRKKYIRQAFLCEKEPAALKLEKSARVNLLFHFCRMDAKVAPIVCYLARVLDHGAYPQMHQKTSKAQILAHVKVLYLRLIARGRC